LNISQRLMMGQAQPAAGGTNFVVDTYLSHGALAKAADDETDGQFFKPPAASANLPIFCGCQTAFFSPLRYRRKLLRLPGGEVMLRVVLCTTAALRFSEQGLFTRWVLKAPPIPKR
jgi:hypothetical protein